MEQVEQLFIDIAQYPLIAAIVASCSLIVVIHFYYKNKHSYWAKKGVKTPKNVPFFGSFLEFFLSDRLECEKRRVQEHGKVYGIYQGTTPILVVADAEILQQICIKDFDAFPNHEFGKYRNPYQRSFLIALKDEYWKRVRATMSPTFTSGKIKRMFKLLDVCADDLVDCFREQIHQDEKTAVINAKELYSLYTMDAITTCCYGIRIERSASNSLKTAATRNELVRSGLRLFQYSMTRMMLSTVAPRFILERLNFQTTPARLVSPMAQTVGQIIKGRRQSSKKFDDYLQILLDAKLEDNLELDEMDLEENHHAGLTKESLEADQKRMVSEVGLKSKLTLSDWEVLSNGIFLMIVGLETTGTMLTHCSYMLAYHQEIQARLYDELMKIAQYNEDKTRLSFNYEDLTACKYLDAVISETLRRLSPVIAIDRISNRDYYIKKYNIHLPKDSKVFLALHAIMNDPDYWEKPEEFNPDRFMPGNREEIVPGSYCPFGIGPRHCIGMRFSLTEAKLALAKLMMSFRFVPAPGTKYPIEPVRAFNLYNIKTPLVTIVPRV